MIACSLLSTAGWMQTKLDRKLWRCRPKWQGKKPGKNWRVFVPPIFPFLFDTQKQFAEQTDYCHLTNIPLPSWQQRPRWTPITVPMMGTSAACTRAHPASCWAMTSSSAIIGPVIGAWEWSPGLAHLTSQRKPTSGSVCRSGNEV